jgi:hypothetical protein
MIKDSGEHLLTIINDLLDISLVERGSFPFEAKAFALVRLTLNPP